jgi:hypothetical protein
MICKIPLRLVTLVPAWWQRLIRSSFFMQKQYLQISNSVGLAIIISVCHQGFALANDSDSSFAKQASVEAVSSATSANTIVGDTLDPEKKMHEIDEQRHLSDEQRDNLQGAKLHIDEQSQALQTQRLQLDGTRLQLDEQGRKLQEERLKLDERRQQLDEQGRHLQEQRSQMDAQRLQLDESGHHLDEERLKVDKQWHHLDEQRLAFDKEHRQLEEQKRKMDETRGK